MLDSVITRSLAVEERSLVQEGLALLNRTQGQGLFGPRYLDDRLTDAKSAVIAAFQGDRFVGLAVVQVIANFDYYLPFDATIGQKLKDKVVGSFATSAVVEDLQGKGIGRILSKRRMAWAEERGCEVVLGVSWISGLPHNSKATFEGAGFHAVARVEDFYRKISLERPFDCPGCRQSPCLCAAILYRRDVRP
jgi:GNAT superfamily N-acetyltransferase